MENREGYTAYRAVSKGDGMAKLCGVWKNNEVEQVLADQVNVDFLLLALPFSLLFGLFLFL